MEKRGLSYSECMAFNKHIVKAMVGVIELEFKVVYENIDSARDMVTDWRYDDEILLSDYAFFVQMLNQAIETLCFGHRALLLEILALTKDGLINMMVRYGIKRDC